MGIINICKKYMNLQMIIVLYFAEKYLKYFLRDLNTNKIFYIAKKY